MASEIENRINGLEGVLHGMYHNQKLLEFISLDLHNEPFNLSNNLGLLWIWKSIIAVQIIDLYKLIGKDEKHSFVKILNLLKSEKALIDYSLLDSKVASLKKEYDKTTFENVRSKFLAHLDINLSPTKTDIFTIKKVLAKAIAVFRLFSKTLKYKPEKFSDDIWKSFKKIFDAIDEYEKIKSFLFVLEMHGKKKVSISDLAHLIHEKS